MQRDQFARDSMRRTGGGGGSSPCVCPDPAADWAVGTVRYFALDPDAGNDANTGYSDVSMAAAGAVARATLASLVTLIPLLGANRSFVIAIKPKAAGASLAEALTFKGYVGYRSYFFHATSDFSNTTTDKRRAGATNALTNPCIASVGPNADGTWTVDAAYVAGSNVIPVAAGALPAADSLAGFRIRFVTCASAPTVDSCNNIKRNGTGTTTVTVGRLYTVLTVTAGDTFYIERPGVVFTDIVVAAEGQSSQTLPEQSTLATSPSLKGLASLGSFTVAGPGKRPAAIFCELRGAGSAVWRLFQNVQLVPENYRDEVGASILAGVAFRSEGTLSFSDCGNVDADAFGLVHATNQVTLSNTVSFGVGQGSFARAGVLLRGCGNGSVTDTDGAVVKTTLGNNNVAGAYSGLEINAAPAGGGGVDIVRSSVRLRQIAITNVGGSAAVRVRNNGGVVQIDEVSGSTGNTGAGLNLSGSAACQVIAGRIAPNTVTGTAGDVLVQGSLAVTHAQVAASNIVDGAANRLIGIGPPSAPQALVDAASIATPCQAADVTRTQRYQVTLTANRTMALPSNPKDGQRWAYLISQDGTGGRTITWTTGAGGFLFGLSIPLVNVVLGTAGPSSADLVMVEFSGAFNRAFIVGFVAGYA